MLTIHQLRNATIVLTVGEYHILVDPMLGDQGSLPPFAFIRYKAQKNPTVPLPDQSEKILSKITHCIITHNHPDHIDQAGEEFLREHDIPVYCSIKDEENFTKRGLNVVQPVNYWEKSTFLNGTIEGIPAKHGYGFVAKLLGNVMGFFIQLPKSPSIYLTSDTIYTKVVHRVLTDYQPAISIVPGGLARFDIFKPLLMNVSDLLSFVKNAPGKVLINHLESINHCPATRKGLGFLFQEAGLGDKALIPKDGGKLQFKHKL